MRLVSCREEKGRSWTRKTRIARKRQGRMRSKKSEEEVKQEDDEANKQEEEVVKEIEGGKGRKGGGK